jgi:hypothetical protein
VVKYILLLTVFILLFSFCFSFLSFDFIEASFIDNIKFSEQVQVGDIKYNSDNKYIYLSIPHDDVNSIWVVDTLSNKIINRINDVGKNPSDIVYNLDNKLLYIVNFEMIQTNPNRERDPIIFLINSSSNEVIKNITGVGKNPSDIVYNPDNKLLYIINHLYTFKFSVFAYVTLINPINGDIIEKVLIGDNPKHILYNPSDHKLYITKIADLGIIVMDTSKDE